jgi:hypothetical protein
MSLGTCLTTGQVAQRVPLTSSTVHQHLVESEARAFVLPATYQKRDQRHILFSRTGTDAQQLQAFRT